MNSSIVISSSNLSLGALFFCYINYLSIRYLHGAPIFFGWEVLHVVSVKSTRVGFGATFRDSLFPWYRKGTRLPDILSRGEKAWHMGGSITCVQSLNKWNIDTFNNFDKHFYTSSINLTMAAQTLPQNPVVFFDIALGGKPRNPFFS